MKVNAWRMSAAHDGRGLLMYFDPFLEDVSIRCLTAPERADRLTRPLSVSASGSTLELPLEGLLPLETDADYDPTHTELNDGPS